MPVNKNALLRYKIIDRSLRNRYRRWTIEDLVDAVSDALYDMEGIQKGVSLRTVQADIQMMRSDKLGYNAPIEVYDQKFYRYADPNYSIIELPLTKEDVRLIDKAVDLLAEAEGFALDLWSLCSQRTSETFRFYTFLLWQASPSSPSEQRVALPLSHTSLLDFRCKGTIPLCSLSA